MNVVNTKHNEKHSFIIPVILILLGVAGGVASGYPGPAIHLRILLAAVSAGVFLMGIGFVSIWSISATANTDSAELEPGQLTEMFRTAGLDPKILASFVKDVRAGKKFTQSDHTAMMDACRAVKAERDDRITLETIEKVGENYHKMDVT